MHDSHRRDQNEDSRESLSQPLESSRVLQPFSSMGAQRPASRADRQQCETVNVPQRGSAPSLERRRGIAAALRHLAMQRDLLGLATVTATSAADLARAERAQCLFYDAESRTLWAETRSGEPDIEHDDSKGLAGFAVRSGNTRVCARAETDPVYCQPIDDPCGDGSEHLIAQPIIDPEGNTHAVVVVARDAQRPMFDASDTGALAEWGRHAGPLFHAIHLEAQDDGHGSIGGSLYRAEAIEAHRAGAAEGDPLLDAPRWTRWAYLLLLLVALVGLGYLALARIPEHASGPAVIVAATHRDVTVSQAGVVASIAVQPGETVSAGQVVARLSSDAEQADLRRAESDLEHALAARLRDPANTMLEERVAQHRSAVERARARLEERQVRVPTDGVVGDVRIASGQAIAPGQSVVTLVTDADGSPRVRAFVPGRFAASVEPGQRLTIDLDGLAHASQRMRVTRVGEVVLGPAEMARTVGPRLADAIPPGGSVVLVEAKLPTSMIETEGRLLTLHDGMLGRADVRVGRERALFVLFPKLHDWLADD